MPSLNWIGKEKIVNHDKDVPFRLMRKNKKYSLGESENLILEGDNLEALKALMPFYYGKIKCIYIDPPYNTGNEKWVYNDKVNAPKIKEWFGKVVDRDDLSKHDKWACMMYPRLKLLKDLLKDDGVIFISIDENEFAYLKLICDEIFSEHLCGIFVWQKKYGGGNDSGKIATEHEYILAYSKYELLDEWLEPHDETYLKRYKEEDEFGRFFWDTLERPGLRNPIDVEIPFQGKIYHLKTFRSQKRVDEELKSGEIRIVFVNNKPSFQFKQRLREGKKPRSLLRDAQKEEGDSGFAYLKIGSNAYAKEELRTIFGRNKDIFENPKPSTLIKYLITIARTSQTDVVLDSFAGSGTTAHAVLQLNKEEKGSKRKFILVEMEKNIAKGITAERVKRVARGYEYNKNGGEKVKVPGLDGGFEYVELGEPLFNKDGMINKAVSFEDMARYVYFTETRTNLEKKNIQGNYLGEFSGNHYFLLFDGIDKNILDRKFIKELKPYTGKKVVYADKCLLDEEVLEKHQVVFKQIPYAVKVY